MQCRSGTRFLLCLPELMVGNMLMTRKIMKAGTEFRVLLVLSPLAVASVSLAQGDPQPLPPGQHLNITAVLLESGPPDKITIVGDDLDFGGSLVVTLGELGTLNVTGASPTVM